jgi:hypothetical protein
MDLNEYILKDREFLHYISNQLVVTQACAGYLKKKLDSEGSQLSEKDLEKLGKLNTSVKKIFLALKERKEFVSRHRQS